MPLPPGTTLGPYQIDAPLGAGGMGEVYKATDTRLDQSTTNSASPPTADAWNTVNWPTARNPEPETSEIVVTSGGFP